MGGLDASDWQSSVLPVVHRPVVLYATDDLSAELALVDLPSLIHLADRTEVASLVNPSLIVDTTDLSEPVCCDSPVLAKLADALMVLLQVDVAHDLERYPTRAVPQYLFASFESTRLFHGRAHAVEPVAQTAKLVQQHRASAVEAVWKPDSARSMPSATCRTTSIS